MYWSQVVEVLAKPKVEEKSLLKYRVLDVKAIQSINGFTSGDAGLSEER
jgi:hypothetical protein